MPTVINGFGTWYYGKRNVHVHAAGCEFCSRYEKLKSYDTTLYFTALYIPLIPLGSKRIIDECPVCRKHRVAKLADWNQQRAEAIEKAVRTYNENSGDVEAAKTLIGMSVFFEDETIFLVESEKIEARHGNNAQVMASLARAYSFFNYNDAAVATQERLIALEDTPATRYFAALLYLHTDQPANAAGHLSHNLEAHQQCDPMLLEMTVRGLQSQGMHPEAIALIEQAYAAAPATQELKPIAKLLKQSQKLSLSGKRVGRSPVPKTEPTAGVNRGWNLAKYIGPGIVALLILTMCLVSWNLENNPKVYLVNGLDRDYSVSIAGHKYRIRAGDAVRISVAEGDVTATMTGDNPPPIDPQTCHISTSFFTRLFQKDVFAINPDRAAVLVYQHIRYSASPSNDEEPQTTFHGGDFLTHWSSVDFPFSQPPNSIKLDSNSSSAWRTHVEAMPKLEWKQKLLIAMSQFGKEKGLEIFRNEVAYGTEDSFKMAALAALMEPEEAIAFFKTRLDDRPLQVGWHRAYQSVMERAHPEMDLEPEYERVYASESTSADALYLLGRVTSDWRKQEERFIAASRMTPASPYALYALAYGCISSGRFVEGLAYSNRAVELAPGDEAFRQMQAELLHATGQYAALSSAERMKDTSNVMNSQIIQEEVYYLLRMKKLADAENRAKAYVRVLREDGEDDFANQTEASLLGLIAYVRGNEAEVRRFKDSPEGHPYATSGALLSGDFGDKSIPQPGTEGFDSTVGLIAYAMATARDNELVANRFLGPSTALLRAAARQEEERRAADWLEGDVAPPMDEIVQLTLPVEKKRVILIALFAKFPSLRGELDAFVQKMNFDRRPHHLEIETVLRILRGKN